MKPAVLNILTFSMLFISVLSYKQSDTDTSVPATSTTKLLIQSAWKVQSVAMDANRNGEAYMGGDLTATIPACQLNNNYTFKTDSTGIINKMAAKCATENPQTKPFTGVLKSCKNILTNTCGFTDKDAANISIDDSLMAVSYDDGFRTSTSYTA